MADERKTELMDTQDRTTALMPENDLRKTELMNRGNSRQAELMGGNDPRQTEIMGNNDPRQTEVMNDSNVSRTTSVMHTEGAIDFTRRTSIDKYKIKKVIAENTGEASLLLTENEGLNQVIKLYHMNTKPDEKIEKALDKINSPYIMHHNSGGVYDGRTFEVLPYFEKGDLTKHLPMSSEFIENVVVKSINEGLKVLHDNGVIHRDIKPSNLFLSDDETKIVLGDFGISSLLDTNVSVRATSMSRTFGYSAPEASSGFVSKESDYYSFGITLLHLAIGQDPFADMTDMQILYQTINKPLTIPKTVPPRLTKLIKGLTIKDRNNRWSYNEVVRWLNNEDVEVKERKTYRGLKPYTFNYNRYYGLDEISMAFANDWKNATKHLYRGLVEKNVLQYGEEYSSQISDIKSIEDQDVAVFKMIYILNPHAPLCFRGKVYTDLQSLGMSMQESGLEFDEDIYKLISSGCLLEFVEKNNFNKDFKEQIRFITEQIQQDKKDYYFALMYLLYPEMGFNYEDKKYVNLEDFVNDLEKNKAEHITKICQGLISNKMFIMWIYSLGYTKQVENWMKIYEKAVW